MGFFDFLNHVINFCAPAAVMGLLMPLASRIFQGKKLLKPVYIAQAAIIFIACLTCLAAGLWYFGRDGKMATYGLMLVVAATSQFVLNQGWKSQ